MFGNELDLIWRRRRSGAVVIIIYVVMHVSMVLYLLLDVFTPTIHSCKVHLIIFLLSDLYAVVHVLKLHYPRQRVSHLKYRQRPSVLHICLLVVRVTPHGRCICSWFTLQPFPLFVCMLLPADKFR